MKRNFPKKTMVNKHMKKYSISLIRNANEHHTEIPLYADPNNENVGWTIAIGGEAVWQSHTFSVQKC